MRKEDPYERAVDLLIDHDFFLMGNVWQKLEDTRRVNDVMLRYDPMGILMGMGIADSSDEFDPFDFDPFNEVPMKARFKQTKSGKFYYDYPDYKTYLKDLCSCGAEKAKTTHSDWCDAFGISNPGRK